LLDISTGLYTTKDHCMKTYGGGRGTVSVYRHSTLDGNDRSGSRPGRFAFGEWSPGTHWWYDMYRLYIAVDREDLCFCHESIPGCPQCRCSYWDLPTS